jgi:2-isopropylmalate synthase
VEALAGARRSRLHIFLATSPIHMERKLRMTPDQVAADAAAAVAYARDRVDEVEFSCEDATRSEPAFVARVCAGAVDAGADVINLPDTTGYALPNEYRDFIRRVIDLCAALEEVTVSAHCHDDLGLAVANSLAAVEAGVGQVECTVNGIGERAGNAALEEIVMALRVRDLGATTGVKPAEIAATSRLVERLTEYGVPPNKAIVGANAFAHEAGIHQDGVLKDVETYQIMDPGELGVRMTLPLGKHSGRHAFARACAEAGIDLDRDALAGAFQRFKALADGGTRVTLADVFAGVAS